MHLKPVTVNIDAFPSQFHPLLSGAKLYDSSCSPEATVLFIEKDGGYFLKSAPKSALEREVLMTEYFHTKSLSPKPLSYLSDQRDWLLTEKVPGEDCIAAKYLEQPKRLCDIMAERLLLLHAEDCALCPVPNHTKRYLAGAKHNMQSGTYDKTAFPDSFGYRNAEEAWAVVAAQEHLLQTDTLLHGDYCLPNIILNNWRFSGFIDLDNSGIGDFHVDVFWALWTLRFNLKTDEYRRRFIDAYGRNKIDADRLRLVAAVEVFG